jgi:hypothetical protein
VLYSCFDPQTGLYNVFEDGRTHPVNGDLPVPQLSSSNYAGTVGVPAMEAGRKLPGDASQVGTSWNAKGLVVNCGADQASGLGEVSAGNSCLVSGMIGLAVGALVTGVFLTWLAGSLEQRAY